MPPSARGQVDLVGNLQLERALRRYLYCLAAFCSQQDFSPCVMLANLGSTASRPVGRHRVAVQGSQRIANPRVPAPAPCTDPVSRGGRPVLLADGDYAVFVVCPSRLDPNCSLRLFSPQASPGPTCVPRASVATNRPARPCGNCSAVSRGREREERRRRRPALQDCTRARPFVASCPPPAYLRPAST